MALNKGAGSGPLKPSRYASYQLLIERIDVAPDGISVTLHAAGIRSLIGELADQEPPAPAASEPLLEAAE